MTQILDVLTTINVEFMLCPTPAMQSAFDAIHNLPLWPSYRSTLTFSLFFIAIPLSYMYVLCAYATKAITSSTVSADDEKKRWFRSLGPDPNDLFVVCYFVSCCYLFMSLLCLRCCADFSHFWICLVSFWWSNFILFNLTLFCTINNKQCLFVVSFLHFWLFALVRYLSRKSNFNKFDLKQLTWQTVNIWGVRALSDSNHMTFWLEAF